jgi:hypothetical protein
VMHLAGTAKGRIGGVCPSPPLPRISGTLSAGFRRTVLGSLRAAIVPPTACSRSKPLTATLTLHLPLHLFPTTFPSVASAKRRRAAPLRAALVFAPTR